MIGGIRPDPTPEEVAAIVAAIELAWPHPVLAATPASESRWRFSGRPWRREDGWSTRRV